MEPVEMSWSQVLDLSSEGCWLGHSDPLPLAEVKQVDCVSCDLGSSVVLRLLPRDPTVLGPHLVQVEATRSSRDIDDIDMSGRLRAATSAHQSDSPVPRVLLSAGFRHRHHAVLLAVHPVLQELFDGYPSALVLTQRASFPLPKDVWLWFPRAPDVISEDSRGNKF